MNEAELEQIRNEFETAFAGRRFGQVFQLGRYALAIDFYPHNGGYLFVDAEPKVRKTYVIKRRLKQLERSSIHPSQFVIQLRKMMTGRELSKIQKLPAEKVLRLDLGPGDDSDRSGGVSLIIQLGGKQSNLFILDDRDHIIAASRDIAEDGQTVGETYIAPSGDFGRDAALPELNGRTLSEILDDQNREGSVASEFAALAGAARKKINNDIAKRRRLISNLEGDLTEHGNAGEWKRFGDLILANISNIRRDGDTVLVTDYFDPELPEIAIAVDKNRPPAEAADSFFKRYTKARNGAAAIAKRLEAIDREIKTIESLRARLEIAIEAGDEQAVAEFLPAKQPVPVAGKRKLPTDDFKGARQFMSSDGFEILVGKKAKDNDYLTFRVAKSLDLWLHAADYPGSHVVVKNPNRKEIPTRTLIESAQLAAFYSDARETPKAAVNYTQKKFVNKPKRAAPGLVSLASFKTILVVPKVAV